MKMYFVSFRDYIYLIGFPPGVNFNNILSKSQKQKKGLWFDSIFSLLESARVKPVLKTLAKSINPRGQFYQHFTQSFYTLRSQNGKID